MVAKDSKFASSRLREMGIKHGVSFVERSFYIGDDGEMNEDDILWREDRRHSDSDCMQKLFEALVWMRCLAPDPEDMWSLKTYFCWVQWMALICDVTAAVVAILTFSSVTYCCGEPILDMVGNIPWQITIRIATYAYLVLVFFEIYPVVRVGFPFNVVNPIIGFAITIAMFFDDSLVQALTMWCIEFASILCEFGLYRLKVRQISNQKKELKEVSLQTKTMRELKDGEDPDAPKREMKSNRRRYYQLKKDLETDNTMLWFLGMGSFFNFLLAAIVLAVILVAAQGGGLCIADFNFPNMFDLDQLGSCPICENTTGVCEVCTNETMQCYYPYG